MIEDGDLATQGFPQLRQATVRSTAGSRYLARSKLSASSRRQRTGRHSPAGSRATIVRVLEVNQPHKHLRSRRGKSDAIDAEAAARRILAGEVQVIPKDTGGTVESICELRVAQEGRSKRDRRRSVSSVTQWRPHHRGCASR